MKVTITLCRDKEEVYRLSNGRSLGNSRVGSNRADIYIVHPSWDRNWETYSELDYPFRRVLNHEYVHCPFWQDRAHAKRLGGYPDDVLPSWYNQGLAEYISENFVPSWKNHVMESVKEGRFARARTAVPFFVSITFHLLLKFVFMPYIFTRAYSSYP